MIKKILKKIYNYLPFKKQSFYFIKTIYPSIPKKIYQHLYFKDVIKIKIDKDHSFKIHHYGYRIENEIFWKGIHSGFEKVSISLWMKLCKHADVIFDIGANTGVYALIAQTMNPDATVFAFEPVKRVYEKLNANIHLNNYKIISSDKAVSNKNGKAIYYDTGTEHIHAVTVNKNLNEPSVKVAETEIETIKLASVVAEHKLQKIDVMKIDVETHEPEVLEGMEQYLLLFKPVMLIEFRDDEVAARVQKIIAGMGYLYFNIDEDHGIRETDKITQSDYSNFLLCNESAAKELNLIK